MTNLNNTMNRENNIEGGNNNMRGPVVISATKREGKNAFLNFDRETHMALSKKALRDTLYSLSPVCEMITVTGQDEQGNLDAYVTNTQIANGPVIRALLDMNAAPCEKTIVQMDDDGEITSWMKVTCNVKNESGMSYIYSDEIVLVRFKIKETFTKEQKAASQALVDRVLSEGLTIVTDKDGNKEVVFGKANGKYVKPLIWTPSNERNGQILMTSLDHGYAWNKLEEIGGGSISKLLGKGEISLAKFKKLASRLGLFATPAVEFEKIGTKKHGLLLINTELLGTYDFSKDDMEKLKKVGVEIDNNQWDGACYYSAEFCLSGLRNLGLKRLNVTQALMYAMQLRVATVYAKVFGEALSKKVIQKMADYIMSIFKDVKDKDGNPIFRVIGNQDSIDMILDANGAKLIDLDLDEKDGLQVYLLDIAKGSESGTATQMTDKFSICNRYKTANFLRNRAKEECIEYADSIGDAPQSLLDDNINVPQMLINLAKNNPGSTLDAKVSLDQYIFANLLKDVSKKHEAAYRKGRVRIDSEFQRALFDVTMLLTDGKIDSLLRADSRGAIECYSTDILERYADKIAAIENSDMTPEEQDLALRKILTATIIKYPTPGTEEIELVLFLTEKQIKRRIGEYVKAEVIDAETAVLLFNYFAFTSYGTIKIAADNAIKHKLAGMDTDYDGVVVILERELVEIIEELYASKTEVIRESTGSTASYGGCIPFIDSHQDAENFFEVASAEQEVAVGLESNELGTWAELFK